MISFKQNNEITYDDKALVEENSFIGAAVEKTPIPTFCEVKEILPQPIWDNHEDYIRCYWKVWEIAFNNLFQPKEGTGFISNYIDAAFNGCIFMWDSAFMLMFGKYADRIFKFQKTFDNFYSHQHVDGFICRQIEENTGNDVFARHDPALPDFVGWTGIVPISVMFEYVFGIKPDAANKKISWHINRLEKHGIEKYPFGIDGELTLICDERKSADEKPNLTIKSNVPVTVELIWGDNTEIIEI